MGRQECCWQEIMFCPSELELSTLLQLPQFFSFQLNSAWEGTFPKMPLFFSCAWGLWLSTHWEQHGRCSSFMGAGQSSQGAQPRGENGTQTQGKALPILMLSRLETKHFMSAQQIETKHSYLRNVKMLHFDPKKKVKTEHGNISEHDCYNSRKQFFPIFCPSLFCSEKQKFKISQSCT